MVEWIVFHVIEHTATHLGHMQLTKQMWEESKKINEHIESQPSEKIP
jgi:hypothetical protein